MKHPGIFVLGLGGTYCSGKSTIARELEDEGAFHIDVDRLGHQVLQEQALKVVSAFGAGIIARDGEGNGLADTEGRPAVDRRALGRIVFADPSALTRLEAIVHPAMAARVEALIRQASEEAVSRAARGSASPEPGTSAAGDGNALRLVVVNAALLIPMGLVQLCDLSAFLDAPFPVRLRRGLARDHLGIRATLHRMARQKGLRPNTSSPDADIPIVKTGTSRKARERLDALVQAATGRNQDGTEHRKPGP